MCFLFWHYLSWQLFWLLFKKLGDFFPKSSGHPGNATKAEKDLGFRVFWSKITWPTQYFVDLKFWPTQYWSTKSLADRHDPIVRPRGCQVCARLQLTACRQDVFRPKDRGRRSNQIYHFWLNLLMWQSWDIEEVFRSTKTSWFGATTISITTLSIMIMKRDTQHNNY